MKVAELKDRTPVEEITLKITSKDDPREVSGGTLHVCNCQGEDDSGSITVTLWNEDIGKVNIGDTIKITNGWASAYGGKLQVSSGKRGKLEVV